MGRAANPKDKPPLQSVQKLNEELDSLRDRNEFLNEQLRRQKRLSKLVEGLLHNVDDESVLCDIVLKAALAYVDCEAGSLMLFRQPSKLLEQVARAGKDTKDAPRTFSSGQGFAGIALAEGKSQWASKDAQKDSVISNISKH